MPNIDIKKNQSPAPVYSGDVFQAMRGEIDRLFDSFGRGFPAMPSLFARGGGNFLPCHIDVRDEGAALVVEAEIPGVDEKDVTVTVANGVLTIAGEKKSEREEKDADYYVSERSFGSFQRSLRLPPEIDEEKIEARFEKGVLRVRAAKRAEAVKAAKKIEITKS